MCRRNVTDDKIDHVPSGEEKKHVSPKVLFRDMNFYFVLTGAVAFSIRRSTYVSWLGSGWPEWVAENESPEQFNQDINRLQSIVSFTLVIFNLLPGMWIDLCRKIWRDRSDSFGEMLGLSSSYAVAVIAMSTASVLQAQQLTWAANTAVVLQNLGTSKFKTFSQIWRVFTVVLS